MPVPATASKSAMPTGPARARADHCRRPTRVRTPIADALVRATRRLRSRRGLRRRSASSSRSGARAATRPSAARSASPTRRCGARSSSTRWSGRTCTTTRCATPHGNAAIAVDRRRCSRRRSSRRSCSSSKAPLRRRRARRCRPPCSTPVEWLALGFEIIDCVYPDWKFQPADFVAAYGLHAALIVGEPHAVDAGSDSAARRAAAAVQGPALARTASSVAEGSGSNSLRSPALCLAELAAAIARQAGASRSPQAIWSAPAR